MQLFKRPYVLDPMFLWTCPDCMDEREETYGRAGRNTRTRGKGHPSGREEGDILTSGRGHPGEWGGTCRRSGRAIRTTGPGHTEQREWTYSYGPGHTEQLVTSILMNELAKAFGKHAKALAGLELHRI